MGAFIVGYFTRLRLQEEIQNEVERRFVAAVAVGSQVTGQVRSVLNLSFWTLESLRATRAFLDVVEEGSEERAALVPTAPAAVPDRLRHGIRVEGLGFHYWNRDRPALSGIDLELRAGTVVALVGENGAGKSTFVTMLSGLYRSDEGRVLVDGTDLARFAPDEWSARITAAFQDPVHLEMSLRDSVGLGLLERRDDPERIMEALRAADLIVVLDGGRVVETGTHDTLSRADGLYAELFRLQARYFV